MVFGYLYPIIGWRGMFMVGVIPAALLILYIYACVPESRFFSRESARQKNAGTIAILRAHGKVALFAIILMTGFNFFSHGTQDVYTTFLRVQHHFDPATVKNVLVIANIGAIIGGLFFGSVSQSFGRRKTIILVTLLALAGDLFLVAWHDSRGAGRGRFPGAGLCAGRLGRGACPSQ